MKRLYTIVFVAGLMTVFMAQDAHAMASSEAGAVQAKDLNKSNGVPAGLEDKTHERDTEEQESGKVGLRKRILDVITNTYFRGARHVAEMAYVPAIAQTLWVCKDVALCFCPGSNLVYCCVAGGVVVMTLADLGWSIKDIKDNTVIVGQDDDDKEY